MGETGPSTIMRNPSQTARRPAIRLVMPGCKRHEQSTSEPDIKQHCRTPTYANREHSGDVQALQIRPQSAVLTLPLCRLPPLQLVSATASLVALRIPATLLRSPR